MCHKHRKISCWQLMHELEKEVAQHNLAPFAVAADDLALCNVGWRIRYRARKSCDFKPLWHYIHPKPRAWELENLCGPVLAKKRERGGINSTELSCLLRVPGWICNLCTQGSFKSPAVLSTYPILFSATLICNKNWNSMDYEIHCCLRSQIWKANGCFVVKKKKSNTLGKSSTAQNIKVYKFNSI